MPDVTARIEQLLLLVLEAPEAEQQQALAAACREAPELATRLQRRVQDLSRFGMLAATPARNVERPATIGPYRILDVLGQGGMGLVYAAEHEQLGRRVALKCIRPEFLGSERARERFRRETQAVARLQHPGLCTLYETGEWQGQPFLAMQFVTGEPLDLQLRRARTLGHASWSASLSADQQVAADASGGAATRVRTRAMRDGVELIAQLAAAVHEMHEAGVVHRDLKPGNVMVTPGGKPVLLDFGLARDLLDEAPALTLSSDVVGTPAYMAPEQVEPRGRAIDRRTDVHALGALLYECLTLRPPFLGVGREDTYRRILTEEPVELRRLQSAASRDLAGVVHKALRKDPRQRFRSAAEFAAELQRVLHGEPTQTRPAGPLRRGVLWAVQRPALAASLGTLFVVLAAGLVVTLVLLRQAGAAIATHQAIDATARDPALGAILAAEALDGGGGEPARSALYGALTQLRLAQTWPAHNSVFAIDGTADVIAAGMYASRNYDWTLGMLVRDGKSIHLDTIGRPRLVQIDAARDRLLMLGHLMLFQLLDLRGQPVERPSSRPEESQQELRLLKPEERIPYGIVGGGMQDDTIFTATRDGWVRLFDSDGRLDPQRSFRAEPPPKGWLCIDRNRRDGAIALGGKDGSVALFAAVGEQRWSVRVHHGQVRTVAFAPDGSALLTAAGYRRSWEDIDRDEHHADHAPRLLDPADGSVRHTLRGHWHYLTDARWSPDGSRILTTSEDRTACVWNLGAIDPDGQIPRTVMLHEKVPDNGRFFPDGQRLVTAMSMGEAVVWDVLGRQRAALRGHGGGANVATVLSSDRIATGTMSMRLLLWDAASRWLDEFWAVPVLATAAYVGDSLWTVSATGFVQCWRSGSPAPDREFQLAAFAADERVTAGFAWPEHTSLVVATSSGRILEIRGDGTVALSWQRGEGLPPDPIIRLIPAGERLLLQSGLETLTLLAGDGERTLPLGAPPPGHPNEGEGLMTCCALAFTNGAIAVGTNTFHVLFSSEPALGTWTCSHRLDSTVTGVAPDPGARSCFAATRGGGLYRVDPTGYFARLGTHLGVYVAQMVAADDGMWLALACGDRRVRIVDRNGVLRLTLPALGAGICKMGFSPDGQRVFAASHEGEVKVWPLDLVASGVDLLAKSPYQEALAQARRDREGR